jgi:hypothetical protein
MAKTTIPGSFRRKRRRHCLIAATLSGILALPLGLAAALWGTGLMMRVWGEYLVDRFIETESRHGPGARIAKARDVLPESVYEIEPERTGLSQADLAFGEQQVRRMVQDCPEMSPVKPSDPIWRYCAEAFAGRSIGERVYWEPVKPSLTYVAEHNASESTAPPHIRVGRNDLGYAEIQAGELWSRAAYELENIKGRKAFQTAWREGRNGNLGRDEWLRAYTKPEYLAFQRTRAVHDKYWLPTAKLRGLSTAGVSWGIHLPNTYEKWIIRYSDPESYPWNIYGKRYDRYMSRRYELKNELRRLKAVARGS